MNKGGIVLIVIAAVIFIIGFALGEYALDKMNSTYYGWAPPFGDREYDAKIDRIYMISRYSKPISIVLGVAGGLWLIVSALQSKKKED